MRRRDSRIRTILKGRRALGRRRRRPTPGSLNFGHRKSHKFAEPLIILHELRVVIVHEPELREKIAQDIVFLRGTIGVRRDIFERLTIAGRVGTKTRGQIVHKTGESGKPFLHSKKVEIMAHIVANCPQFEWNALKTACKVGKALEIGLRTRSANPEKITTHRAHLCREEPLNIVANGLRIQRNGLPVMDDGNHCAFCNQPRVLTCQHALVSL